MKSSDKKSLNNIYKVFNSKIRKVEIQLNQEIIIKYFAINPICDQIDQYQMLQTIGREDAL